MTKEKLEALENQLDRINPKSDPLRYRRQEMLVRQARQELAVDKQKIISFLSQTDDQSKTAKR